MSPDRFSSRTHWDRNVAPLAERLRALRAAGETVIDLTESNPTRCGLDYPREEILRAIAPAAALGYRPAPRGIESAREAVAAHLSKLGPAVDPSSIVLTSSTSEAYAWLMKLLCAEGDEMLIPAPSYPLFDFIARLEGVRLVHYPLEYDGRWRLDAAALEKAAGPRARAVIVVQPNNPTGSYLDAVEIAELEAICSGRGMAIIADEVFADYPFEEREPGFLGRENVLTFVLGGLSKAAGLPQMKLSWIVSQGPAGAREEALARLEIIGDTFLSVGGPVQIGVEALLATGEMVRKQIRDRVRGNRALLLLARDAAAAWDCLHADGGWYAVLRVPRLMSDEEWAMRLLDEDRVHIHPGYLFDFPDDGHLVVSLLPERAVFEEGMRRVAARIAKVAGGE